MTLYTLPPIHPPNPPTLVRLFSVSVSVLVLVLVFETGFAVCVVDVAFIHVMVCRVLLSNQSDSREGYADMANKPCMGSDLVNRVVDWPRGVSFC